MEKSFYPKHGDPFLKQFTEYLDDQGWKEEECAKCGGDFFRKDLYPYGKLCGSFECCGNAFLEHPSTRHYTDIHEHSRIFVDTCIEYGVENTAPKPLVGYAKKSIFLGSGGQIFDNYIFGDDEYDPTQPASCVVQPVVRLYPYSREGFSYSFVNTSIGRLGTTAEQHMQLFEVALEYFSRSRLYVGNIAVKLYGRTPDWGNGEFESTTLGIYYGGVDLGDFNYFTKMPIAKDVDDRANTFSDLSIGLERVAWASNRFPQYKQTFMPPEYVFQKYDHRLADAYRTMVLMLMQDLGNQKDSGSSKEARQKMRSLANSSMVDPYLRHDLIDFFSDQWQRFNLPNEVPQHLVKNNFEAIHSRVVCKNLGLRYNDGEILRDVAVRLGREVLKLSKEAQ